MSTAKSRVFDYLFERIGEWVDGAGTLDAPEVGGSEGLRRLREARAELRERGFRIEGPRRHPNHALNRPQYRLVRVEDVAQRYAPLDETPDEPKRYLCPRAGCAYVLSRPVPSEFDAKMGFGECEMHGMQMVTL